MDREEAINIVRKNIPHLGLGATEMTEALESLIPELSESEDERIRKKLIGIFTNESMCNIYGLKSKDVLAYLERQKEQKPAEWSEEEKRCLDEAIETLDKLGYDGMADNLKHLHPQPKQEWGEEDENARRYIHELISFGYTHKFMDAQTAADMKEWINKSIRPQPKVEWSEEDKENIESICSRLDSLLYTEDMVEKINIVGEIAWLKSLRPSWKPNDEDEVRLINTTISFLDDFKKKGYENAVECIDWLKSKLNGNSCK